ncbi:MAG: hypothetical protein ACM3QZ_02595 [Solirubrobacterales bacterium]
MDETRKCPICKENLVRVADELVPGMCPEICPDKLFGLTPIGISEQGAFEIESSHVIPVVAMICSKCGFVAQFIASKTEEDTCHMKEKGRVRKKTE